MKYISKWQENGLLYVPKGQSQNAQAAQMFSDPNMATDMMKKNLSMIIPQVLHFSYLILLFFHYLLNDIDTFLFFSRLLLLLGSTFSSLDL